MSGPYMRGRNAIPRRTFLRGCGVGIALPMLQCMKPATAGQSDPAAHRMLVISNNLGVLPKPFFPTTTGRDYSASPYLRELESFRDEFTVFSGLSHPGVIGGHSTENCFLTAARGPTRSGFRNRISLDQFAADELGPQTRFSTLNLGVNIDKANRSLSWTRDGALLPAEDSPAALFRRMFVQGTPSEVERRMHELRLRGSILDAVTTESRQFTKALGPDDRQRLDQYFSSVRELEQRLQIARQWESRPKPTVQRDPPQDILDSALLFEKCELMLSMAQLALQTDSTRIVTLMVDGFATGVFRIDDETRSINAYHNLSHHGQVPEKVKQLEMVDRRQIGLLRKLFENLSRAQDGSQRLLDSTMILYGSNMGDSNTHDNTNLPILLAGGGFRHGQHLAFPRDDNAPLCNLYLSMLLQMGVETDAFSSSTGTLSGLETRR
jgi:hypothetical protein